MIWVTVEATTLRSLIEAVDRLEQIQPLNDVLIYARKAAQVALADEELNEQIITTFAPLVADRPHLEIVR